MASSDEVEAVLNGGIDVIDDGGGILRRVMLLPYGTFRGRDGRGPWVLEGKAHANEVIAATRQVQGSADIMFDYDHQSALAAVPGVGGRAKAAGWIKPSTLTAGEDGIYGDVEWTRPAEAALRAREYRYHSPHFRTAKGTGRVTRIVNAGLTNSPNLDFPALASQQPGSLPTMAALLTVEEKQVCAMLGMSEKAFHDAKMREAVEHSTSAAQLFASEPGRVERLTTEEASACEMLGLSPEAFVAARDEEVAYQHAVAQLTKEELQACEMTGVSPQAVPAARDEEAAHQRAVAQLSKDELRACEMTGMKPEDFIRARGL